MDSEIRSQCSGSCSCSGSENSRKNSIKDSKLLNRRFVDLEFLRV